MLSVSIDTRPQSFLPLVYCFAEDNVVGSQLKKSAVQVCQVATVVMETTQLVLSQFENFSVHELIIVCCLSLPKIISECCELVKLCHINRSGPVFLRHTVYITNM